MIKSLLLAGLLILPGFTTAFIVTTESFASLAYTRVSIESVDTATPSLTFKTMEGQVWTLQATSAEILKGLQQGRYLQRGDRSGQSSDQDRQSRFDISIRKTKQSRVCLATRNF